MKTYTFTCNLCQKEFKRFAKNKKREEATLNKFCSRKCKSDFYNKSVTCSCGWCFLPVTRTQAQASRSTSGKLFCDQSCAASFNNTQKRKSRRSKCEKRLFELLHKRFPLLNLVASDKTMLDGLEADIAIPSLNLCIEWNGIVHFQPIFGQEKLNSIQNNDIKKQVIAQIKGIELIVIPDLVSSETYVKEAFLKVSEIVQSKMNQICTQQELNLSMFA